MKRLIFASAFLAVACNAEQRNEKSLQESLSEGDSGLGFISSGSELITVNFEKKGSDALIGGDILFPLSKIITEVGDGNTLGIARVSSAVQLWANGRIPYELPPNFWLQADWDYMVSEWAKAGIMWVPKTSQDVNYVTVIEETEPLACGRSYLGQIGGAQRFRLRRNAGKECNMRRTVIHEAAHAAGFMHEHQRSDRDNFVKFNGPTDGISNLMKYENTLNDTPYDILSITHYGSLQTNPRMVTLSGKEIPQTLELSAQDIAGVRSVYDAFKQSGVTQPPVATPVPKLTAPPVAPTVPSVTATPLAKPTYVPVTPPPVAPTAPTIIPTLLPTPVVVLTARPASTVTPTARVTVEAPIVSLCRIIDVNQSMLLNQNLTRTGCEQECSNRESSSPNRRCEWAGQIIRRHPVAVCTIKTQAGKPLASRESVNINDCGFLCGSFSRNHPARTCQWGSENLKN